MNLRITGKNQKTWVLQAFIGINFAPSIHPRFADNMHDSAQQRISKVCYFKLTDWAKALLVLWPFHPTLLLMRHSGQQQCFRPHSSSYLMEHTNQNSHSNQFTNVKHASWMIQGARTIIESEPSATGTDIRGEGKVTQLTAWLTQFNQLTQTDAVNPVHLSQHCHQPPKHGPGSRIDWIVAAWTWVLCTFNWFTHNSMNLPAPCHWWCSLQPHLEYQSKTLTCKHPNDTNDVIDTIVVTSQGAN